MQNDKTELRDVIKKRISKMTEEDRDAESRLLCSHLKDLLPSDPVGISAYMPMDDEVDIKPLIKELLELEYSVFLPRYEGSEIRFYKIEDLSNLIPGSFNIPEPHEDSSELNANDVSYALVPGRAFDKLGNRLGRGHGGYDKWIKNQRAKNQNTTFLGVCYECQIVQNVPTEDHDERMDVVVTAKGS
jgi:5-formyltetrahydrofolate cyclo-ligase